MRLTETFVPRLVAPPSLREAITAPQSERFVWTLVPRQGQRPLGFEGRVLIEVKSRDPELPVWSEARIHETEEGRFVVEIRHLMRLDPVAERCHAEACGSAVEALGVLRRYDVLRELLVDVLYAGAGDEQGAAREAAALDCAARLRNAWQQMLQACFGNHQHEKESS